MPDIHTESPQFSQEKIEHLRFPVLLTSSEIEGPDSSATDTSTTSERDKSPSRADESPTGNHPSPPSSSHRRSSLRMLAFSFIATLTFALVLKAMQVLPDTTVDSSPNRVVAFVDRLLHPQPEQCQSGTDDHNSAAAPASLPTPISADELFRRASPSVIQVVAHDRQGRPTCTGTGFLVSKKGLIVTNYHVIQNAYTAQVILADNTKLAVSGLASRDGMADLAILKVPYVFKAEPLELGQDELPIGAKVYAIGNPRGFSNTMSDGLVSGYRGTERTKRVQTTAPISPGSSGGPLFGADGRVVGVTTSARSDGQNLNFAVPASNITQLLRQSESSKEVGVSLFPLAFAEQIALKLRHGQSIAQVREIAGVADQIEQLQPWAIVPEFQARVSQGGRISRYLPFKSPGGPVQYRVTVLFASNGEGELLVQTWRTQLP